MKVKKVSASKVTKLTSSDEDNLWSKGNTIRVKDIPTVFMGKMADHQRIGAKKPKASGVKKKPEAAPDTYTHIYVHTYTLALSNTEMQ